MTISVTCWPLPVCKFIWQLDKLRWLLVCIVLLRLTTSICIILLIISVAVNSMGQGSGWCCGVGRWSCVACRVTFVSFQNTSMKPMYSDAGQRSTWLLWQACEQHLDDFAALIRSWPHVTHCYVMLQHRYMAAWLLSEVVRPIDPSNE